MALWLLKRINQPDYEEVEAVLVNAPSEAVARELAAGPQVFDGLGASMVAEWLAADVTCDRIGDSYPADRPPGVLLVCNRAF